MWTVEVFGKNEDAGISRQISEDLGIDAGHVAVSSIYYFYDDCTDEEKKNVAEKVLIDPITQEYRFSPRKRKGWIVEVAYKSNVTDPVEASIVKAVKDIGVKVNSASAAARYFFSEKLSENEIRRICTEMLANEQVQHYSYGSGELKAEGKKPAEAKSSDEVNEVSILGLGDNELMDISVKGILSLSIEELRKIQSYFQGKGRNPTDAELECIAQTWSEHCKHKTFSGDIILENNGSHQTINNLFKSTIVAATNEVSKNKKWLVSVFKDNAGIIDFDGENYLAFKVETHNHPSALDPYGGSSTGIGGVIRDVIGAGLGAKPIFNTDVFCFGMPDYDKKLPAHVLHPKRTFKGVVAGVRDYGNRMGIPTINGSVNFHDGYLGMPLVFCGTAGIMPKGFEKKSACEGDSIVVIGGKTGRDGIHGATFSSVALEESSPVSAVQIGNAIEEKRAMDAILYAQKERLYTAITDCGAGGFSSAVGEMGESLGAEVWLEKAPLKYQGLKPWEIWVSESQERMVLSVPEKNLKRLTEICERENAPISVIGKFTGTKKLVVKFNGKPVLELDMDFLHSGLPRQARKAIVEDKKLKEPKLKEKASYDAELKKILSHPSVASKEWVIRQYDHEVQGSSVLKPLVGIANDGPGDASVVKPVFGSEKAVAISNGINPRYGLIDSYCMAASAIDEAVRNIIAVGGDLGHTAMLDNFCWGNTDIPKRLGSLAMAAMACKDIAIAYDIPFISGKDSLHNEIKIDGKGVNIPDTLLISAVSVMDAQNVVSMDLKEEGSSIYIVGKTYDELGASQYYNIFGEIGENVPRVRAEEAVRGMTRLSEAMKKWLVRSCHDCSEGGIAVAASEMAFAGGIGMEIDLKKVPYSGDEKEKDFRVLFSESNSRFIVEVKKGCENDFEAAMMDAAAKIGSAGGTMLKILGLKGNDAVSSEISELKNCWQATLKW
ncbi:MAG: phosphoribosylformylglycinamidine synthase subunit PurL [Candidatus Woesearchaeota archaeon]